MTTKGRNFPIEKPFVITCEKRENRPFQTPSTPSKLFKPKFYVEPIVCKHEVQYLQRDFVKRIIYFCAIIL